MAFNAPRNTPLAQGEAQLWQPSLSTSPHGTTNPQAWAETHRGALVSTDIGDTTVADVHAYAVATYEPTPRPGENPSAVTDDQIEAAVAAVRDAQQPDA